MIGLGTYAFFWQHSDRATPPLSLDEMLRRTQSLGGGVFQICDYRAVLDYDPARLQQLKAVAQELGIVLELGTKGIRPDHLAGYLRVAEALGVKVIRSMVTAPDHRPTLSEAEQLLRAQLPAFAAADVTIALETYEQLSSRDLVALVEAVGSERLGICLDPANCVAALEHPIDVIHRCAPYVKNLHVKDFAFTRRGGWVGFTLEGTELGTGLLPYDEMIKAVRPEERGIHRIVEHWLTWQDDFEKTVTAENNWNAYNLAFMRQRDEALGKQ
ncbi:sugar phosphate isomerase/epimerase family protein [Propionivibrio dicarboxylicus]|uniref:Sugar phosphate isomerase/epimerase n=1 Tax=Propionivibrio dicarboxylicus TaxID=83767 RepID=A0A1G8KT12_9RHOO|nr:TIM barrel protein [Propionivibrio dicarboxylicus]SDI46581.1 Sugar phosphate isomerase/epimerase [Propionivibrio dicarboxylicus]